MTSGKARYISQYNKRNYKMFPFRVKVNSYLTNLVLEDIHPSILTIKQIKQRIKTIVEKQHIKDVYLFGSYARGEATRDSDIDIYCGKGDADTLWKRSALQEEFEEALGKEVDIVTIGSQIPELFRQSLEEDLIKIL